MVSTRQLEDKYSLPLYPKRNLVLVRGEGSIVEDEAGKQYIDCVAGHGVANIGHANPVLAEAISKQASTLITCAGTFYNETRARLLEKLVQVSPEGLERVFLCNSGTEAIEAAIKFARISTGKREFICAMKGFHGRTMGALSATFNPKYKKEFFPLVPGFKHVAYNKIEKLEAAINEDTAGIILEPLQGEGGVHLGAVEYFQQVRRICDDKKILLVIDEVQTGFGRTGRMFGVEHLGIAPDMMCVAKAMAGGLPVGAVLCNEKITVGIGKHGSTFGGNPLVCAASIATIDYILDNGLVLEAALKGTYLLEKLRAIESDKIREVRGQGLMIGIELKEKVRPYIEALVAKGVLTLPAGSTVLRLLPPLTIEYNQLDQVIQAIQEVLAP